MREYLVVEQLQESLTGRERLTARGLQDTLNRHAHDGWVLDRIVDSDTARLMGFVGRDVLLLIFSREISTAALADRREQAEREHRAKDAEILAQGGNPWG
jgi:hypothetical protein